MKYKFSLIIPFLVFGATGCSVTNPYAVAKNKIKYSYQDTSKLEKVSASTISYVCEQALINYKKVSSFEGFSYSNASADIVKQSAVKFADVLFEESDQIDYHYCKGELFDDNVLELDYEAKYYCESNPFYNYTTKEHSTQFYKVSEKDPELTRLNVNSSQKSRTEGGKQEIEGSYILDYYDTTPGNELNQFVQRIFEVVDTEPFESVNSMYIGKFFGKDKKGNYYAIFDSQTVRSACDIFEEYHGDYFSVKNHNEYVFENKDGSLYLKSYLSVFSDEYNRDLDGKLLEKPISNFEYIEKYNFEYETKKSASEHGSTEVLSNSLSSYSFNLFTYDDNFVLDEKVGQLGWFYVDGPTYWIDSFDTSSMCYLVVREDDVDEYSPVEVEIATGSTPYVQLIGDAEYKILDFTAEGSYLFGTRYDRANNKLIIRVYYLGILY